MEANKKPHRGGWKPGQSGNPLGKPKGATNHATRMVTALMEEGAREIAQTVVDQAKDGNLMAARIVLDRLAPPVRERSIELELPDTSTAAGIANAQQTVLEAVGRGELTPSEGQVMAGILEARRKALETDELIARIKALEAKK